MYIFNVFFTSYNSSLATPGGLRNSPNNHYNPMKILCSGDVRYDLATGDKVAPSAQKANIMLARIKDNG